MQIQPYNKTNDFMEKMNPFITRKCKEFTKQNVRDAVYELQNGKTIVEISEDGKEKKTFYAPQKTYDNYCGLIEQNYFSAERMDGLTCVFRFTYQDYKYQNMFTESYAAAYFSRAKEKKHLQNSLIAAHIFYKSIELDIKGFTDVAINTDNLNVRLEL